MRAVLERRPLVGRRTRPKAHHEDRRRGDGFYGYVFLTPAAVFYVGFQLLPALAAILLSFTHWNGISINQIEFAGLKNFRQMAADPLFFKILLNSLIICAAVLAVQCVGGFLLAVGIYAGIPGAKLFQRVLFVPVATVPVAVGIVGTFVLSPQYGLLNNLLESVGLKGLIRPWLEGSYALPSVIVFYIVQNIGLTVLLFLAGLRQVNDSMIEAAKIDGASPSKIITRVVLPTILPVAGIAVLLAVANAFRLFDIAYTLTRGGPYYASTTLVLYLYTIGFTQYNVGYANTIGLALFVVIFALLAIQLRLMRATVR